uniref:Prominin 1a n=1 Tax=Oreochromis niloticus TaxID=8128 RepID=A0A669DHB6_ORENI
ICKLSKGGFNLFCPKLISPIKTLPPPGKLNFGYVPAGVYETLAHYEPGPIGILFHMVHAFLYAVQPNAFPHDLIVKLAKDKFGAIQTEYQKVTECVLVCAIYYEIGFLVCAAVGLLFTILMPIVGLFFCMCRCCDNCGGEMHQRQRKNADCRRGLLGTLLFSTSLVITIGVLCAYAANQNLSSQVKNVRRLVNSNMRDLHTFANDTQMQIDYLISQYATAKNKVIYDLDNIGPLLGGRIHDQLDKEVRPALDQVLNMAGAMRETKEALESVNASLEVLQDGTGKLSLNLGQVRTSINRTLNDPGCHDEDSDATTAQLCRNIRQSLSQLQISSNFTRLPDVNAQLEKMNDVLKTDLSAVVQRVSVTNLVDSIGNNISSFSKALPVQSCLSNFTIFVNHISNSLALPAAFRWIGCIALCCMVVLVLAFNYLGLLCGTLGYDKHASPTTRGCISNTGGTMLMAGVGFSFLFSWVLMGVVTIIFLAGGNMEKLVCEPFHTKELFKVVDTPYMINPEWKNFIPGYMYNDSELELTTESLYSTCKKNQGIYSAMRLDKVFNISSYLNTTVVSNLYDVVSQLDSLKIDLRSIILLEAEGRQNLLDFSEAGLSEINYADYLEEVNKGVTVVDLLSFARELEAQTDLMPKSRLQSALKGHVGTLRQIHRQQIVPMEQSMVMPYCVSLFTIEIAISESRKYTATIIGYFHQYIEWVKTSVSVGYLPFQQNTFWMGLGCSTLLLLPSIILAVKLAKYYRRMDTEDVYDDMEIGNNGYHSERLQGIPNPVMTSIPTYDTMNRFPRASAPPRHIDW